MNTLAVIPARGGSKGIPRKNLRDLGGKPLIVWTIEQALAVPDLRVVVSTEDAEIAQVSAAAGAEVLHRPAELAQDTTATEPVVLHAIEDAVAKGLRPNQVVLLQATSPIRLPGTIARALTQFHETGVDSLVGVVPCPPFLWSTAEGVAVPHWDFEHRLRRQDMKEEQLRYRETGSIYVTRTDIYERLNNRLGGRIGALIMDPVEGTDIDSLDDLRSAQVALDAVRGTGLSV